jgi:lipid A 4'-phosphatase
MKAFIKDQSWWSIPVLLLALFTPFSADWDQNVARYFFQGQFESNSFYDFLYYYAVIPGEVLGVLALLLLIFSFFYRALKPWFKPALVIFLTIIVGAVLVVHTLLKDHWGRPRPRQVIEFGGNQPFQPFYQPNLWNPERSRSFPCGHCTMGFCFFALARVCRRQGYMRLGFLCLIFAIVLGIALGIARMAQGGHFLSDVVVTAFILWIASLGFEKLVYEKLNIIYHREHREHREKALY